MKFQIFEQHFLSSWMALLRSQSYISHRAKQQYSVHFWCALEMMTHFYLEISNFHICQWCCINNIWVLIATMFCFPSGSDGKESAHNAGDLGSVPGSGRSLGEGNDNWLQYSFLANPIDRGAWWAIVHEITKSQTQLSD